MSTTTKKDTNDAKGLLQSKTVWGVILMVFAFFAPKLGLDLNAETQSVISDQLVTIVGAVLAIIGRVNASKDVNGVI